METEILSRAKSRALPQAFLSTSDPGARMFGLSDENAKSSLSFWQLANILWRKKSLILLMAIGGGLLAGLAGLAKTPLYEATVQLLVDLPSNPSVTVDQAINDNLTMLVSQAQLRRAATALAHPTSAAVTALPEERAVNGVVSAISGMLTTWRAETLDLFQGGAKPETKTAEDPLASTLEALTNGIWVARESQSRVISLGFSDRNPQTAALVANRFVQAYVDYLTRQSQISIERDLAAVNDSIPHLQSELARTVKEKETYLLADPFGALAPDAARRLSRLHALELELDAVTNRYTEMLGRRESLMQRAKAPAAGITILSQAWPPREPRTISAIYFVPPGVILFGLFGVVIAAVRHSYDDRIRGETQIETALPIRSAGMLPKFKRSTASFMHDVLIAQPGSTHSRAASSILFSLTPNNDPQPRLIVLVTATARDEGKTELAWSLALSASKFNQRVLFIDFDPFKCSTTMSFRDEFGSGKRAGCLADFAEQQCPLGEVLESMPQIGIDYLRSAEDETNIFMDLSAVNVRRSIEKLSANYNLIVLNGPVVIDGPEVFLLAPCVDDVLFALRWGVTRQHVAQRALELFSRVPGLTYTVRSVLTHVNLKKQKGFGCRDTGDLLRIRA